MPNSDDLKQLNDAIAKLADVADAVGNKAANDRFLIQTAIQGLQYKIDALSEKLETLVGVVTEQAKTIRDFENERHEKDGARGAVKFIWAALVMGVTGVAYVLHDVIIYFSSQRH